MDSAEARRILVEGSSGPEPCGLTIRIIAGLLDYGVVIVVLFWIYVFSRSQQADGSYVRPALWVLVVYAIWWLCYYGLFEYFWHGQTPGKRVARIRAVMGSGDPLTPMAAAKRTLARPLDMLPWVTPYALGILFIIATGEKRRQRIGDRWAGTKVVSADLPDPFRPRDL